MAKTRRRKHRTHITEQADPSKKGDPKTFVFCRGKHGLIMKPLEDDIRHMMMPNTASKLKESKRNSLKDFVHVAGPLGVTHMLLLTATETACYLRVAKSPRGPTLTMKIHEYSLMKDVAASQLRPRVPQSLWQGAPLVVLNSFSGEEHLKLATVLFQNLFPSINVQNIQLHQCQRIVLLSYDKTTQRISLRHYSITAAPSGVSKGVKSLVNQRAVPDLSNVQDVADYLTKGGYGSESEGEDAGDSRVMLERDMGRGNLAARQSRVKLQEVGPRLELEVVKVEEGLCQGKVLYHSWVSKSPAEAAQQESVVAEGRTREELREKRRKQQEENVRRKQAASGRKRGADAPSGGDSKRPRQAGQQWWAKNETAADGGDFEDDDDRQAYLEQVGQEPDDDVGLKRAGRGGSRGGSRGGGRGQGRGRGRGRGGRTQSRGRSSAGRGRADPGRGGAVKPNQARGVIKHRGVRRRRGT